MIRVRNILAAAAAFSALALAIAPQDWRYRKPIAVAAGDQIAVMKLDREVYLGAQPDLADIRVLRDHDELPFVLETLSAVSQQRERRSEILNQSVKPGVGLQFMLRVNGNEKHSRVRIATNEVNFRQAVRIETSEDGRSWSIASRTGAIFDFSQGRRHLTSLAVDYPVSTRPYLRVTILGWTNVGAVTAAFVDLREERAASRETLATLTPQLTQDNANQTTLATIDTGAGGLPVDNLRIATASPAFHRAVEIESSADGKDWNYLTQSVIARFPGEETLTISIPETHLRFVRLRVYNRDDKPIAISSVELEGLIRRVKFLTPAAGEYWLYYGNAKAATPRYDLPLLLARRQPVQEVVATLGPQQNSPEFRDVQPWTERHPGILYTVLSGGVLGLAAATLRFALRLRQPTASS